MAFILVGGIYPSMLTILVWTVLSAASLALTYLVCRLIGKFVRENCTREGALNAWRPSIWVGFTIGLSTLVRWAPFGLVAVLVFCINGVLVDAFGQLIEKGIEKIEEPVRQAKAALENRSLWDRFWAWLSGTESLAEPAKQTLGVIERLCVNLLRTLQIALDTEYFLSWLLLIWLTVRSVLYFLARSILAEAHGSRQGEAPLIEVRFDMELLR